MARKKLKKEVVEVAETTPVKTRKFTLRGKDGKPFVIEAQNLKEVYKIINNQSYNV
mgnify:CR=1 FL=1